jgi:hypothetical protein
MSTSEVDDEHVLTLLRYGGRDRLDGKEVMPTAAAKGATPWV